MEYQHLTGHVIEIFLRFPRVAPAQTIATAGRGYVNSRGERVPSPVHTPDGRAPAGASVPNAVIVRTVLAARARERVHIMGASAVGCSVWQENSTWARRDAIEPALRPAS